MLHVFYTEEDYVPFAMIVKDGTAIVLEGLREIEEVREMLTQFERTFERKCESGLQ